MWSQLQFCLLVGLAFASNTPAWKENTQYKYKIQSRTLSSLHDVADQYTGVFLRGDLLVKSKNYDVLQAEISQLEYAQFHSNLPKGWRSEIPSGQLNYKSLPVSRKPFEIVMKNGVVRDLIVDRELSNWEANLIKAIVSQFQLDTNAENLIENEINTRTQINQNSAIYRTMEDTVTGISETQYDIHPLPEQILQSQPELVPLRNLKGDGQVIEIVKNKNYAHSQQRPAYHFGFHNVEPNFEPQQNRMGDFLSRTSTTRAVITGKLERYTIQSSHSVEEILVRPTLNNQQQGSVRSIFNITLEVVESQEDKPQDLANGVSLGNLVYRFNSPYTQLNKVRPGEQHLYNQEQDILNDYEQQNQQQRLRQIKQQFQQHLQNDQSFENSIGSEEYWQQDQPELEKAAESPLLPFTVGFQGQSIKNKRNIVELVDNLSLKIAEEFQQPNNLPQQNTISKYITLVSLVRVMDESEIQEAAQHLYKNQPRKQQDSQQQRKEKDAWMVFRDAVSQAGTGPALLSIQTWIETNKVQNDEAADIISVIAQATRQPTQKYMQRLFDMMKSEQIMNRPQLNDSVILSFTELVHKVYVNKRQSHSVFPVHSFGDFHNQHNEKFLKDQVLPYVTQQLHQAISENDVQKIHVYIRALGNIGHPQVLAAFKPYLEGKKQASQFQRVLMVVALDKLVNANPSVAQGVLYRIYQNTNEQDQVRTAAVFQLMRTNPSVRVLQRMAEYTNIDTSDQVNSAVKSSIETASQLEGEEFSSLRTAAQSAVGLLNNKKYGAQHAKNLLKSYVSNNIQSSLKQTVQTYGAPDSFMPQGLRYTLRERMGGVGQPLIAIQVMVSSIEDLTNVFAKQTKQYQEQQHQKQQQRQQTNQQDELSSENIARLLGIDIQNNEQLEGNLQIQLLHLQKVLSFNNQTIKQLPQFLREIENIIQKGEEFHHSKMVMGQELAVAFPTEIGWPFIYTYDKPLSYRFEGKIKAKATPQVSSGQSLDKPHKIELELNIRALVSGKVQSQFGFITPFDAKRYSAGYDKNIQVHIPIQLNMDVDIKHAQIKMQIKSLEPNSETQLMHYSTWPYTTNEDIFSPEHKRRQIIKREQPRQQMKFVFGQKSSGIAFQVKAVSDEMRHFENVLNKIYNGDHSLIAQLQNWDNENIAYSEYSVKVDPQQTSTHQININFGYQNLHHDETNNESTKTVNIEELQQNIPENSQERQQEFLQRVSSDIPSSKAFALDASIEFKGDKTIKYTATGAVAKSNVNPKSRVLFFMKQSGDTKPNYVAASGKCHAPNTNGLDLNFAMNFDPTSTCHIQVAFGEDRHSPNKLEIEMKARKSDERQRYLKQDPMYAQCQKQQKRGNKVLQECEKMVLRANLMDQFSVKVNSLQMNDETFKQVQKLDQIFRHMTFSYMTYSQEDSNENNRHQEQQGQQQRQSLLKIEGQFATDLKSLTVAIETNNGKVLFKNMPMNQLARQVLVSHPVFHMKARLLGNFLEHDNYRPTCVVDKTAINTFNQHTYAANLASEWTVMALYAPRRAHQKRQQSYAVNQIQDQVENYAVLVRSSKQNPAEKDVKIVFETPETQQQNVEISLKPTSSNQSPKVLVNGKEVRYNNQQSSDMYNHFVQIYGLPNNEVKIELNNAFYVIYDGTRVKLTLQSGKFRSSVRGICDSFTDDTATALQNPQGCIVASPQELIDDYTLNQSQQHQREQNKKCHQKQVSYVNVITKLDVSRQPEERDQTTNVCTKHQTRYVEVGNQLCFTLKPLPVCKDNCRPNGMVSRNVAVHCVRRSNAAELWKKQIDKGASPDFSLKAETSQVGIQIPQTCQV